jgi:hypothetical protein
MLFKLAHGQINSPHLAWICRNTCSFCKPHCFHVTVDSVQPATPEHISVLQIEHVRNSEEPGFDENVDNKEQIVVMNVKAAKFIFL